MGRIKNLLDDAWEACADQGLNECEREAIERAHEDDRRRAPLGRNPFPRGSVPALLYAGIRQNNFFKERGLSNASEAD